MQEDTGKKMASADSPTAPSSLIFMPLIIALCIIASVVLALLALHSMILRLCGGNPRRGCAPAAPGRVDKMVLDAIPIHAYSKKDKLEKEECAVCLGELEEGDSIRALPACAHVFHVVCVDPWLVWNRTCPFCRAGIALAEVLDGDVDDDSGRNDGLPCLYVSVLIRLREKIKLRGELCIGRNSRGQSPWNDDSFVNV